MTCGFKNAKGDHCVLDADHNPGKDWKVRPHKTEKDIAAGKHFTYLGEREKAARMTGQFGGVGGTV